MAHIKTGFQVGVWLLFTIGIVISYTVYATKYIPLFQTYEATIWVAIGVIVCTSVCLALVSYVVQKRQCKVVVLEKTAHMIEALCLFIILITGIYFHTNPTITNMFVGGTDQSLFQLASVSQFQDITKSTTFIQQLYVDLLHTVFLFWGNIFNVGIFVQFLLLLVGSVCFYIVLRNICSKFSALAFLVVAICGYNGFEIVSYYNVGMFMFAYSGIVTFALYQYFSSADRTIQHLIWSVVAGILSAMFLAMDLIGTIAIIAFILISIRRCIEYSKQLVKHFIVSGVGIVCMGVTIYFLEPQLQFVYSEVSVQTILSETIDKKYLCFLMIPVLTFSWQKYKEKLALGMCLLMSFMAIHIFQLESNMPFSYYSILLTTVIFVMSLEMCFPTVVTVTKSGDEETSDEEVVIFIPKQMEIPRREPRKKIEFTEVFEKEQMDFDYEVDVSSGYDLE